MNNGNKRLEIKVDVLQLANERAQIIASVMPDDLIRSILDEFQEMEHLGRNLSDYELIKADGQAELERGTPLGEQLRQGDQIALVEKQVPPPLGTQAVSSPLYLREQSTGNVYKPPWLPAIIGRWDETKPENELVAVNLESYPTGGRVSRRQAKISQEDGLYWLEPLKEDAIAIINSEGDSNEIGLGRHQLTDGDLIHLVRSDIKLKLMLSKTAL